MVPKTRNQLKQFCLQELGAPVLAINVAPEQIENQIDKALKKFFDRHFDATEEKHIIHILTQQDADRGYITLSDKIISVKEISYITQSGAGSIWSATYQLFLEDYMNNSGIYSMVGLQDFYITKQHISLLAYFLSPPIRFNFNKATNRLIIEGKDLDQLVIDQLPLVLTIYEKIVDSNGQDGNFWGDSWLTKYTTALIKKQWGNNLKKFGNVQLPGGIVLNGKEIYDEAVEEVKELEEELQSAYEGPPQFFIG